MNFRTEIDVGAPKLKISLNDQILSLGSCFANHIGGRLAQNKFSAKVNPFGNIFNPISLFNLINLGLNKQSPEEWTYLENEGIHKNYLMHSDVSGHSRSQVQKSIEKIVSETHSYLAKTDVLILTFGTSIIYSLKDNNKPVANCHKMPSANFNRELPSIEQLIESFNRCYVQLKKINPNISIIVTVSPVRHVKDTLQENSVSKSLLRLFCHHIVNEFDNTTYFPSFEILNDDLRDYRFYNADLIHPNEMDVEYVWEIFSKVFFEKDTLDFIKKWAKIKKALDHKPFNVSTPQHQKFIHRTINELRELDKIVNVKDEIAQLEQQIHG